jgi:D-alanyl-lipoteichoic acid acyltransferase DltB (MBOAT superfamily)
MTTLTLANLTDALHAVWRYLGTPLAATPWADWRGFWLEQILDDRFVVIYFLPLLPILILLPRGAAAVMRRPGPPITGRALRVGIIITGLAFMTYIFGVLYAWLWLMTMVAFHRLGERFAIECRRTDVLRIGPPLAAIGLVGGWYALTMVLHKLRLPADLNTWLFANLPWIFPLGARGLGWEPYFRALHQAPGNGGPFQLIHALFWNVHNIGSAYLAIRMLHYFSEIKRGTLPAERRTLLNFLAYTCYAPAFLQGPIERFAVFQDEMDTCHQRRSWRNLPPAVGRMGWGLSKSLIGTLYFQPVVLGQLGLGFSNTYYLHPEQIRSFWLLYFGVFLQIFWLYLEFSGYCDVSAGMARLLGYRQIENFRMPWLAASLRDFWRRWHISLTFILRDYVYIALGGNRRHMLRNVLVTFFLIGIWHAFKPQVGIWGIAMGLMVYVNQLWARWMGRLDQSPTGILAAVRRGAGKLWPLPQVCAWLITQHAFVFSLLIFFGGVGAINVTREIFRRVWQWLA